MTKSYTTHFIFADCPKRIPYPLSQILSSTDYCLRSHVRTKTCVRAASGTDANDVILLSWRLLLRAGIRTNNSPKAK